MSARPLLFLAALLFALGAFALPGVQHALAQRAAAVGVESSVVSATITATSTTTGGRRGSRAARGREAACRRPWPRACPGRGGCAARASGTAV